MPNASEDADMAEDTQTGHADRRAHARAPIERRVVFSGVRGEGLLREGMAKDISASGLLIHTSQPDLVGRHLEIELHPDDRVTPGDAMLVRAEVIWVKSLSEKKQFAMGVRFLQSVPATDATGAHYQPAGREEAERLAASFRSDLAAGEAGTHVEISEAARRKNASARARAERGQQDRRRNSRTLVWLFILAFTSLIVILLTLLGMWKLGLLRPVPDPAAMVEPGTDAETAAAPAAETPAATPGPEEEGDAVIAEEGAAGFLNRGGLALARGRYPAAAEAFQAAQGQPGITPVERYIAQLGEAEALARDGDAAGALAILESPASGLQHIPESWRALKARFRDALLAEPRSIQARAPLVSAFAFEQAPGREAGMATAQGMRIEIDTERYLLTVLENNAIKAVYPVGLGAGAATPEGEYTIVNKIENPDWYNNGDVVPAGDPENQLGSRWLGLGGEDGPTPLGIHATDDPDSIGANQSRGCIRMRPRDIEELFEQLPVGTPVRIRAL